VSEPSPQIPSPDRARLDGLDGKVESSDSTDASNSAVLSAEQRGGWFHVRGFPVLSLVPLLVAVALSSLGAVTCSRPQAGTYGYVLWMLTLMAVGLGAVSLVLGWYGMQWQLAVLLRQIERLGEKGGTGPPCLHGGGDLSSLVAGLNGYLVHLHNQAARLRLQKKELDIQNRIAEAQRRCVETVVEKVTDAVLVTDAFDEVVLVNRAAKEIFGFMGDTAYRQPIHRFIQNPAFESVIRSIRRPEEPAQHNLRLVLNFDTAQPRSFRASLTRVVDMRGQIYGVVTVLRAAGQPAGVPRRA
jgi:PAS domain-containing protein